MVVSATPSVLLAQSGSVPVDDAVGAIEEIVVTAKKREQLLQDVGQAVSAFSGDSLYRERVNEVVDLAKVVPGLDVTPSPSGNPVYTLRGVGFFESSLSSAPDVAVYMDQAPLAVPAFSALVAFDLERVEVLKGPQGTLFGTNATGGAINLIAAKPTPFFEAGIDASFGRFDTVESGAFVSGPLTDKLAGRVAIQVNRADDWQRSFSRNDTIGDTDSVAARALLEWGGDSSRALLNVNGWRNRSDPQVPQLARQTRPEDLQAPIGSVGFGGTVTEDLPLLAIPGAPGNARAADWDPDFRPFRDDTFYQLILDADYDLNDSLTLTSLTAYSSLEQDKASAYSGTDLPAFEQVANDADADDFSQEIRLAGNGTSPLRWLLGTNYERTSSYENIDAIYPEASTGTRDGFTANSFDSRQVWKQWAVFANVEYDLSETLTLKAGVRYTDSSRKAANRAYDTPGFVEPVPTNPGLTNFVNIAFPLFYVPLFCPDVTFTPVVSGDSISINPENCQTGTYRETLKEDNVPWSLGLDYKPGNDLLLYVNASRGFKGGAFPLANGASQAQYHPVPQEELIAYEAGFKSSLGGGRGTLNGAMFYYDYADKQTRGKTVDPLFGALEQLVSIPESRVFGAELDVTAVPMPGLTLRAAATYLDTKIERYEGIVGTTVVDGLLFPVSESFEGVELPFAPELSVSASVDYEFSVSGRITGFVGASGRAQTDSYGSPQLSAQDRADARIDGYEVLDLRAGVKARDERWHVTLWGQNVTDTYYWTNSLRAFDTIVRYTGRPAEYGVTIGYDF